MVNDCAKQYVANIPIIYIEFSLELYKTFYTF